jgi:hypothetical protein
MKNTLFNSAHIVEYIIYGLLASICYICFVLLFLNEHEYQNLYYLYIGNFLFMLAIGMHVYQLTSRPFEGRKSMYMWIAGQISTLAGVLLSCVMILAAMAFLFNYLFRPSAVGNVMPNAPATMHMTKPSSLMFVILLNATVANFCTGSFAALILAYAGKKGTKK